MQISLRLLQAGQRAHRWYNQVDVPSLLSQTGRRAKGAHRTGHVIAQYACAPQEKGYDAAQKEIVSSQELQRLLGGGCGAVRIPAERSRVCPDSGDMAQGVTQFCCLCRFYRIFARFHRSQCLFYPPDSRLDGVQLAGE